MVSLGGHLIKTFYFWVVAYRATRHSATCVNYTLEELLLTYLLTYLLVPEAHADVLVPPTFGYSALAIGACF